MTKIVSFCFEIFNIYFFILKFKIISSKTQHLILNSKSILVNPKILLIKLILLIFFVKCYFRETKLKMSIVENFSKL